MNGWGLSSGGCRSELLWFSSENGVGRVPGNANLGQFQMVPDRERGAKKFTHPESRSRKPELRFPCKVAGVEDGGKES